MFKPSKTASADTSDTRDDGPLLRPRLMFAAVGAPLAPLAVYFALRPVVHSDAVALGIAGGVSLVFTLAVSGAHRRMPWTIPLAALCLGLAVAASAASGGSALPLKLYGPVLTGLMGLLLVVSVAVRRPALAWLLRLLARRDPRVRDTLARADDDRQSVIRRRLTLLTLIVGIACLAVAGIGAGLAFSLSTGSYVLVTRLVGWVVPPVLAIAVLRYIAYKRRDQTRGNAREEGAGSGRGQSWPGVRALRQMPPASWRRVGLGTLVVAIVLIQAWFSHR